MKKQEVIALIQKFLGKGMKDDVIQEIEIKGMNSKKSLKLGAPIIDKNLARELCNDDFYIFFKTKPNKVYFNKKSTVKGSSESPEATFKDIKINELLPKRSTIAECSRRLQETSKSTFMEFYELNKEKWDKEIEEKEEQKKKLSKIEPPKINIPSSGGNINQPTKSGTINKNAQQQIKKLPIHETKKPTSNGKGVKETKFASKETNQKAKPEVAEGEAYKRPSVSTVEVVDTKIPSW